MEGFYFWADVAIPGEIKRLIIVPATNILLLMSFQALDGFIMTVSCSGQVLYTSESITPLIGHLPVSSPSLV